MSTYVLVHGAWGGAHTWKLVRPGLWASGHHVFTPGLTGIGERVHLASPQVGLTTHVDDVVNQILYEDLTDIVLLGFSYGGMVVTGALAQIADRVRELIYLDAFVPSDGQSLSDLAGHPKPTPGTVGEPWLIPPRLRTIDDPTEAAWNQTSGRFVSRLRAAHSARPAAAARLPRMLRASLPSPEASRGAATRAAAQATR